MPDEKPNNTVGRPAAVSLRKVLNGIVYVLRTGCQWKMLPCEYSFGSPCHRRFQQWVHLDIFKKMWTKLLEIYNKKGIKWMWPHSFDSISIKLSLGGAMTAGSSPTVDRSKPGTKRHILTNKNGIPILIIVTSAASTLMILKQ